MRVLGTPCCDCITAPECTHTHPLPPSLPHAKAAPSHTAQIFCPPHLYLTVPPEPLLTQHQQCHPFQPCAETASLTGASISVINQAPCCYRRAGHLLNLFPHKSSMRSVSGRAMMVIAFYFSARVQLCRVAVGAT